MLWFPHSPFCDPAVTCGTPCLTPCRRRQTAGGAALANICKTESLDPTDARLIKLTNSAAFDLPRQRVVVKVAASALVAARIPAVLHVALAQSRRHPAVV